MDGHADADRLPIRKMRRYIALYPKYISDMRIAKNIRMAIPRSFPSVLILHIFQLKESQLVFPLFPEFLFLEKIGALSYDGVMSIFMYGHSVKIRKKSGLLPNQGGGSRRVV